MSSLVVQPNDVAAELDWRRPHPITIVVEVGSALRSVIIALIVVRGGFVQGGSFLELALVAMPLAAALGRWYTTRYALDTETVHHHHGLIWRKKQVLPRSNVQNVSTKAGVVARLGSVVELQISDASATGDISLRYLTQDEADRLTTLLRSSFAANLTERDATAPNAFPGDAFGDAARVSFDDAGPGDGSPSPVPPGNALDTTPQAAAPTGPAVDLGNAIVSPNISELIRAEMTSISIVLLLIGAAVMAVLGPALIFFELIDIPDTAGRLPWLIAGIAVIAPLLLAAIGIGTELVVLGGYRLMAEPDRLRIQVGLLTEARITARRERIQQVRVIRQVLHRRVGLERVTFETADLEAEGTAGTKYLSPVGPTGGWRALATEVFGQVQLDEPDLQPVSPLTARRMFVRFVFAAIPMAALGLLHPLLPVPVIAGWLLFGRWYSRSRFHQLGWAVSADQYLVRSGVIFGRLTLVKLDKIQSLRVHSTFFQRRLGLATVKVSTAGRGFGGLVSLPDVTQSEAEDLLHGLSRRAAATPIAQTL